MARTPPVTRRSRTLFGVAVLLVGVAAAPDGGAAQESPGNPSTPLFLPATALESALPQSSVYDVLEDREGFLWFATREGVARWDGRRVRVWRHDPFDAGSVPGNVIRTLAQDASGDVWITAYDYLQVPVGVARLVGPTFTEVRRYGYPGAGMALDDRGRPHLVGPDSLWRFDPASDRFRAIGPRALPALERASSFDPAETLATGDGWLWIADDEGVERCRVEGDSPSGASACEIVHAGERATAMALEASGALRIGLSSGVARFDPARPGPPESTVRLDLAPTDFAIDAEGVIWVLNEAGVTRIRADTVLERTTMPSVGERSALAGTCIHIDRAGTVRVGTVWGVFGLDPLRKGFAHLEHDPDDPNSPASGLVSALAEDDRGGIWIGTIGGGLNRWDRATGQVDHFRHRAGDPTSLPHDVVWDLALDPDGQLWVGTSAGLARHRPGTPGFETFYRSPEAPPADARPNANTVQDLQLDAAGRLWAPCTVDCREELPWFDLESRTFRSLPVPGLRRAGYLSADPSGHLWVGSTDGILRIDPDSGTAEHLPDTGGLDGVIAFHFSGGGELWVGSNSGLYRLDAEGRLLDRYTTDDGLPSNAVYGIIEDDRQRLWLSTNRGLAMLDLDEPADSRVRSYDRSTGVENVEFNRNAWLEASDGTVFFGGDRGLTWFHPTRIRDNDYTPPVAITAVERASSTALRHDVLGSGAPVRVRPDEESFTFEFAALSYVNAHRNRYRVQLEGFDEGWRELGTIDRATYTRVPPGRYTFRVQGANEDGLWSPEEGRAVVVVEPWPWETTWFRLGTALLLVALVAFVAVRRSRLRYQAELDRLHAQGALDRERARLSRDMHDEVGASLTEIAILSDVALSQATGAGATSQGDVAGRIRRIGDRSREAIDAIGGIIWAIDPDNDGRRVGAHLREYAADVLESADLRAELDFAPADAMPDLSAEARRTMLLVLKEALANIIRHAEARRVIVRLHPDGGTLKLEVEDDGRGLPEAPPPPGHDGIRNMRRRARAAGGSFDIRVVAGGGTRVTLAVPFDSERR